MNSIKHEFSNMNLEVGNKKTLGNKKKNILYVVGRYSSLAWLVSMLSGIQQYLP